MSIFQKIRVYFISIPSCSLGRRSKTHPLIISLLSLNDLGKDADANKIDLTPYWWVANMQYLLSNFSPLLHTLSAISYK